MKRLEWKKNLIADLDKRLTAEPIDLMQIQSIKDLTNLEYRRVKVNGKFDRDPNHQIYLKPRSLVMNKEAFSRGYSDMQSYVGVNVVTPFQLHNSDLRILINRGWILSKGQEDSVEAVASNGLGRQDEPIELIGILRTSDQKNTFGMKNDLRSNSWNIRDVEAMARHLRTAPIYLETVDTLSPKIGPIGGQTQLTVRNEHLNYAITWFSLAALVTLIWYQKFGRAKRFKLV